ncbi:acyltransferase family protein [Marinobacter nauticus]|uniref:acyltransferase family protein n=1 Tax=Marinobacter nauticus TaxID=2743 RepID=UPI001C99D7A5|nr:acyltransferase [Marinobacter nauticus]MBY5938043.1 acyltransferase [Marinobacter nauticus]MBY5955272.1 acyltransferase [Marinobacter nauticus]MBY6009063.1 acyltransferase [Marinobacter nauticus]
MSVTSKQFVWLDWLRFSAAFVVLLTHARGIAFVEYGALSANDQNVFTMLWFAITRLGHEAVIVFFVLSGFLVGGKVAERVAAGSFAWRDYLIDRASRIMVPLVPAIALSVFAGFLIEEQSSAMQIFGNLFSLQGIFVSPLQINAPLWSLSYEVWFYILAGGIGAVAVGGGSKALAKIIVVFSLAVFLKLEAVYLFCWLLGALAYHHPLRRLSPTQTVLALVMTGAGVIGSQITSGTQFLDITNWLVPFVDDALAEFLLAAGIALLVRNLCTISEYSQTMSLFGRTGSWLASFSYTLYLVHYPILFSFKELGFARESQITLETLSYFGLLVVGCLLVSYGFYWLFERRTDTVRHWLRKHINSPQVNSATSYSQIQKT